MDMLSTTAQVLHDMGLAAAFGGTLFAKMALHPSVGAISSREERGKVVHDAWTRFNRLQAVGLALSGVSWHFARRALRSRYESKPVRALVTVNDALTAGALASGFVAMIAGQRIGAERPGGYVPLEPSSHVGAEAPRARRMERISGVMGTINLVLTAGLIGTTTALVARTGYTGRSLFRRRFIDRLGIGRLGIKRLGL